LATRDVVLRLLYNVPKVVAKTDLPAGAVLTTDNTAIEQRTDSRPPVPDWRAPYGLILARPVQAGSEITANDIARPTKQMAVKRNELVVIRIQRPGILVTGQGKAMSDGRAGDVIKVKNVDSGRIILCQVNEDGSVQPIL
jgi:flagella basal body P-ring formation protein FlgA